MADISKIKVDDTEYNIKDSIARNTISDFVSLPKVTSSDNGKILKVVNGVWTAVSES